MTLSMSCPAWRIGLMANPPTFEEVVAYAVDAKLWGKISISKFYDYYAKQNFMFMGHIMDWKSKMQEWAGKQTGKVVITKREADAKAALPKKEVYNMVDGKTTTDVMEYLNWAVDMI